NQLVKLAGGNAYIRRRLNSRETASGEGTVPLSGHRAISTPAISPKNLSKVSNPSKGKEYNDLAAWTGLAQGVHPVQISCRLFIGGAPFLDIWPVLFAMFLVKQISKLSQGRKLNSASISAMPFVAAPVFSQSFLDPD